jgi:eukaryotic-like serine/threonine-protein kinase
MNPERIGGYEIIGELGRGAMGVVYHARDSAIGRPVAIKVIRIDAGMSAQESLNLRQRLIREASAAGKIYHPGIVTVHQLGEEGDNVFIVMEYVEGSSLDHLLINNPALDRAWVLDILAQVAVALDYAHKSNVVHRDIKPANILVRSDGRVKIADFGIAKITAGAASGMTGTGVSLGSPAYMSPEQIQAMQIDGRSDQFALGTVAFLMLTGRMPFKGKTAHTLMYQIVMGNPFEPLPGDIPMSDTVRAVLARALAKHPGDRYPSCAAFIQELTVAEGTRTTVSQVSTAQMEAMPHPAPSEATAISPPSSSEWKPPPAAVTEPEPAPAFAPTQPAKESQSWMLLPIIGGVLAVLLIGAAVYWWYSHAQLAPNANEPQEAKRNVPAPTGSTPLLTAVAAGNLEQVKSLLAKGADVNAASSDRTTPLMLASETNASIADALLAAGAQVESTDASGRTALNRASSAGLEDTMRLLLDHQANVNSRAGDLSTPLIAAVANGKRGAAELLIDRSADVNLADSNNTTPLMVAAEKQPAEFIKLLLTHGAKRGVKDSRGRIAFQIAVESKNAAAVQLLR